MVLTFSAAVVTISDTCSAGTAVDSSGPLLQQLLVDSFQPTSVRRELIPDDEATIESTLIALADASPQPTDLIITTGGTGFGPRDVTPEATRRCCQREAPQLALVMSLYSLQKTKFAALSRAICGIRNGRTLIINMPGSRKAVAECFEAIAPVLPHALQHMRNAVADIRTEHAAVQQQQQGKPSETAAAIRRPPAPHCCPHKTNSGAAGDRNSPYPMVSVAEALRHIRTSLRPLPPSGTEAAPVSHLDLPPFRASIKDGYALRAEGGAGAKRVRGSIAAGDGIRLGPLGLDECWRINTGAPMPEAADCVIQVEDTEVLERSADAEANELSILVRSEPSVDLDVRPIGCDLQRGEPLFAAAEHYPGAAVFRAIMASVGRVPEVREPRVAIVSTGDELCAPGETLRPGQIYDSNGTMLAELCRQFGFAGIRQVRVADTKDALRQALRTVSSECEVTICTGGVSMGDRDFVKPVMEELGFGIRFGRVNMKPGKPMTFAANAEGRAIFGLPGNPVSAFVTFHLFVLPALRMLSRFEEAKWQVPRLQVELLNELVELDARPEYARARVISRGGRLCAEITGDQISSRLRSIDGADVLLHLPAATEGRTALRAGELVEASVLKHHFISRYE